MEDIRIFLSGFHENEFEKIRLAIQTAGGVSLGQLTSSVTHMVIKKQVPHHFKILRELDLKPYKVTIGKKHALKKYDQFYVNTSCFCCAISRNFCYKDNE